MEGSLEDCIWGKSDWDRYTKELVGANTIDEEAILKKINVVKENIGRQIREAVSLTNSDFMSFCFFQNILIYFGSKALQLNLNFAG